MVSTESILEALGVMKVAREEAAKEFENLTERLAPRLEEVVYLQRETAKEIDAVRAELSRVQQRLAYLEGKMDSQPRPVIPSLPPPVSPTPAVPNASDT